MAQGQLTGGIQPITNWFPDTLPAGKLHCKLSGGQGRSWALPKSQSSVSGLHSLCCAQERTKYSPTSILSPRSTDPSLPPSPPSLLVAAPVLLLHISDHGGTVWCQLGSAPKKQSRSRGASHSQQPQPRNQSLRDCAFNSIWRIFFPWTHSSCVKLGEFLPAPAHPRERELSHPSFLILE